MDKGQFLLCQTPDGESQIEVKLQDDTVWLSLDQMAELFQRNKSTISRHIRNVLEDGELDANSVIANFATTASDGIGILDDFLKISRKDILTHAGKISAKLAKEKADKEYDKFKERTKNDLSPVEIHFLENFEREQKRIQGGNKNSRKKK